MMHSGAVGLTAENTLFNAFVLRSGVLPQGNNGNAVKLSARSDDAGYLR